MNNDHSMQMIGHYHMRAQFHIWKMFGNGAPIFFRDFAKFIQSHFFVRNFTKQTLALKRYDCDKIRARLGIIKLFQPN